MYEELKRQKIKELEGLVEEQEAYVTRMGKVGGGGGWKGMAAWLADGVGDCLCCSGVLCASYFACKVAACTLHLHCAGSWMQ
jgi:hypothetical protein